jgi:leucyl-tRNA synthetase
MPVDLYVGGAEHAVLHLRDARFWMKALYDGGYIPQEEPFKKLRNQGTILGPDGQKMSKSKGNVVNPDEIIKEYGADTLRLYEMFLGPLEQVKPWDPKAIVGVYRFLQRVWRLAGRARQEKSGTSSETMKWGLHKLVKKVTEDLELLKFNTAIAAMMEFVNLAEKEGIHEEDFRTFLLVLSPFAPHIAEVLWTGPAGTSIAQESWPSYDPVLIEEDQATMVVQINGKPRAEIIVPRDADERTVRAAADKNEAVQKWLAGKSVQRVVVVPNRLISFVTTESS